MGLLESLFGADGIGGQPGAVGNAMNAAGAAVKEKGVLPAVLGGVGKVIAAPGNLAVDGMGDWLADVVTKNPVEILKNPMSVLNDKGEVSITRILFPEYRRGRLKEAEQLSKAREMEIIGETMSTIGKLRDSFTDARPDQRAGIAQQYDGVIPDAMIDTALGQAGAEDQRQAEAAQAVSTFLPPDLAAFVKPENAASLYVQNKAAEATAAERAAAGRRADDKFDWQKKSKAVRLAEALDAAIASGDPVKIEAARAELEGIGKSSQPMVVNTPDGGTIVGPASEVTPFVSNTAKDRALQAVDSQNALIDTIGEVRALAGKNPEAFGAAGAAGGFAQNVREQGRAFRALQARVAGDIKAGGADDAVAEAVAESFNPAIPALKSLEMTLAYAKARANNPDGKISDSDFKAALVTVRGGGDEGGFLSNAAATTAILDVLEREAVRDRDVAQKRAGGLGKGKSKLSAAVDAKLGKGEPKEEPKKKRRLGEKKPTSEMTDDELQKELLRIETRQSSGQ